MTFYSACFHFAHATDVQVGKQLSCLLFVVYSPNLCLGLAPEHLVRCARLISFSCSRCRHGLALAQQVAAAPAQPLARRAPRRAQAPALALARPPAPWQPVLRALPRTGGRARVCGMRERGEEGRQGLQRARWQLQEGQGQG